MTSDDSDEVWTSSLFFLNLFIKAEVSSNFQIYFKCPLCMEPFEVDDTSFYPCTCGYQVRYKNKTIIIKF